MLIEQISLSLGMPADLVDRLANGASHLYKTYTVPKRNGGTRTIHHPARALKGVQRWLAANVISDWPVHQAAKAYREGVSIFDNAALHSKSRYLLRMDFSGFFESIQEDDVRRYIAGSSTQSSSWSPADIDAFCNICLRFGRLTIGAPTSPSLANALCYELDRRLEYLCAGKGVTYSRYADDLFFSTAQSNVLAEVEKDVGSIVAALQVPAHLSLNADKTRHSSKKGARHVTGIVLGSDGKPYIGRHLKRRIRAMIHTYDSLSVKEQASLSGLLAYAIGLDPDFKNSLIEKYGLMNVQKASRGQ